MLYPDQSMNGIPIDTAFALVLTVTAVAATLGAVLAWLAARPGNSANNAQSLLIDRVNELLPQTQCAQCGYPGCRPYAEAIVNLQAPINQCPPGAEQTIDNLASLLAQQALPLDTSLAITKPEQIARINEPACIGCTLCIQACPVDAIVGATRLMHTVLTDNCTGCELCLPPCPVDCIELIQVEPGIDRWLWPKPE